MARKLKSDKVLFMAMLLLVCASIVMVYSASAVMAMERYQQPYLFLSKQAIWALIGLVAVAVVMRIDYRVYREPVLVWTALGLVTACLVAVLFSAPINGTHRWFGVAGIGVQPSELAKLAIIFYTAVLLERRMHRINDLRYALAPIAVVVVGFVVLILRQPDFGTAVAIVLIASMMVFAAGLDFRYIAAVAVAALPIGAWVLLSADYRRERLLAFLSPESDPLGSGFQILQSLISVGTGGLVGRGLMGGVQKLFYLPEPHTDFIYAVIGEEFGLLGTSMVLAAFVVIMWRGLRIARRAPDAFGAFLAIGLTAMIAAQAFINMSVVLGLLPTKGIPLPFVSAGGSSLLVNLVAMGILLNLSQHASTVHEADEAG